MKPFLMFTFAVSLTFTVISCKNDKAASAGETAAAAEVASPNDSKALEGTGAKDISVTHKLDQTQIVQEGNVAFNFKSTLQVKTKVTTKTVPEYRPSYVITIPKKDVKGIPVIKLDGSVIPVFGMK